MGNKQLSAQSKATTCLVASQWLMNNVIHNTKHLTLRHDQLHAVA